MYVGVLARKHLTSAFTWLWCSGVLCYSSFQKDLPAMGLKADGGVVKTKSMDSMYKEYVEDRTRGNWKFWIVSFTKEIHLKLMIFRLKFGLQIILSFID